MSENANITITPDAVLHVYIKTTKGEKPAYAVIISDSGETIIKIVLTIGNNVINISPYMYKNYAIRVVNGGNVTVQKI